MHNSFNICLPITIIFFYLYWRPPPHRTSAQQIAKVNTKLYISKYYRHLKEAKLCLVKKDTKIDSNFLFNEKFRNHFNFFTWISTWLYGSWHHQTILKKYPFWKHDSWFSSEVTKLTSVFYLKNDAWKINILSNNMS